jgi:hypothetical protein
MDHDLDDLLESGERLRVSAAWLRHSLEGYVNTSLWHGNPNVFFFEVDDGEVYAIERDAPSLCVERLRAR